MSDDAALADTTPPVDAGEHLRSITKPEFRTVSVGGSRTGVRLERVFWDALEVLSAEAGQRRARFVSQIVEGANDAEINATGAIRSTTVALLLRDIERLRPLSRTSSLLSLLQAGPAPAFALDQRKRLVQSNPEFLHYLRSVAGTAGAGLADSAQLSLERPLASLFQEVEAGKTVECGISIRCGNRDRQTRARILMVPPAPSSVLVGYVLS